MNKKMQNLNKQIVNVEQLAEQPRSKMRKLELLEQENAELEQTNRELTQKVELLTQKIEQLAEQPWSKMRKLEDIAPSKIKWFDIYCKNIVNEKEPYEFFLNCSAIKTDLPAALDAPSDTLSEMQETIVANGITDSESFSSMFHGNIITFLTNSLQSKTVAYKFRVTPVVYYHPENHKYSDYIILRFINKSVKIVVEIKKKVTSDIISAKAPHIAQLFHEVALSEKRQRVIAIYGSCFHSHVFVLDDGTTP